MFAQTLLIAFFSVVSATITNLQVSRKIELNKAGSSLVSFQNSIRFRKEDQDKFYFYTIAKDYEWSFVEIIAH